MPGCSKASPRASSPRRFPDQLHRPRAAGGAFEARRDPGRPSASKWAPISPAGHVGLGRPLPVATGAKWGQPRTDTGKDAKGGGRGEERRRRRGERSRKHGGGNAPLLTHTYTRSIIHTLTKREKYIYREGGGQTMRERKKGKV